MYCQQRGAKNGSIFCPHFWGHVWKPKAVFVLRWRGRLCLAMLRLWVCGLRLTPTMFGRSRRCGSSCVSFRRSPRTRVWCKPLGARVLAPAACSACILAVSRFGYVGRRGEADALSAMSMGSESAGTRAAAVAHCVWRCVRMSTICVQTCIHVLCFVRVYNICVFAWMTFIHAYTWKS